jgi:hypothetical protein
MFVILIVVGAGLMVNDWGLPVAALEFAVAVAAAVSVQVPPPTKLTTLPETVHRLCVLEVTEIIPSPA